MSRSMIIAARAYSMVEQDCIEYPLVETGGLLIGAPLRNNIVVPFVVPAGEHARRSPSGFAPDSPWQQRYLDYLFQRFHVDYCGDYHKHPAHFDHPSQHDWRTARHIVTDPAWGKREALFPIVVVRDGRVCLRAYLMRRATCEFEEIPIEIVPDTDRRIRAVLLSGESQRKERRHERHSDPTDRLEAGDHGRGLVRGFVRRLRPRSAR